MNQVPWAVCATCLQQTDFNIASELVVRAQHIRSPCLWPCWRVTFMCWDINLGAQPASNALASCGHAFSKSWIPAVLGTMFAHLSPLVEGST